MRGELLNEHWRNALYSRVGVDTKLSQLIDLVFGISGVKDPNAKHQLKSLLPSIICGCTLAVHCAAIIAGEKHPEVKEIVKNSFTIGISTHQITFEFISGIWSTFLPHFNDFIKAEKWFPSGLFTDYNTLSSICFFICWSCLLGYCTLKNRFADLQTFVKSIVDATL